MPHIVSTLTNSQLITDWKRPENAAGKAAPAVKGKSVLIKGTISAGATGGIQTPGGAVTRVTDEELEFLERHDTFIEMFNRGHFKVLKDASEPAPKIIEKATEDMPKDDGEVGGENGEELAGSAQLSIADGDFEDGGRAAGPAPGEQKII